MSDPFIATHTIPAGGINSWPRPDPAAPPGPHINAGLEAQLVDQSGDWAKITFDNGWTAWVDGRLLVPRRGAAASGGAASAFDISALMADRPKAFAVGGAALVALSSVLPWFRAGGQSSGATKISMQFLFDYKTHSTGGIKIGHLLWVVAVLAIAAVWRGLDKRVQLGAGIAAIVISVLYVVQLQRYVSAFHGVSLTDTLGFGVLPALVGGAFIAFAPKFATYKRRA